MKDVKAIQARYRNSEGGRAKRKAYILSDEGRRRNLASGRKSRSGWSPDQVEAALRLQDGRCWICRVVLRVDMRGRGNSMEDMCADHNHETKKPRGLLCRRCNNLEGILKDQDLSRFGDFGERLKLYYLTFDRGAS